MNPVHQTVLLLLAMPLVLIGCSSSPYQSKEWTTDKETRERHVNELVAQAGEYQADGQDPSGDAVRLRSDSVAPLAARDVTQELQAIAEELARTWYGGSCHCEVRVGPSYSFGGFTYPEGTIVIQAGTLEYFDTRDEVAALLAHELSHLWLDHHQKNELQSTTKGITDLAQAISLFGNDEKARETTMRIGGSTDALVAAAGFTQWNREQETEADLLAVKILEKSRYSPMAMIALLTKLKNDKEGIPLAGSAYEEMMTVAALKARKQEAEVSDNQLQKWLSSVASDMGGREYLSSEERRNIVRMVIYDLDGAILARSFTDLGIDVEDLAPVTSLKTIHTYPPASKDYVQLVDRALASEPENLHLQLLKFRALLARGETQEAQEMAKGFIARPDAGFSVLSEATRFLDQLAGLAPNQKKQLMHGAVSKLAALDLPDAYVADEYYLSNRYQVPGISKVKEKLCEAGAGKVAVRERCDLAKQALERNVSFYQLLATVDR
jgi:Zn-dependent protease with chaperone function